MNKRWGKYKFGNLAYFTLKDNHGKRDVTLRLLFFHK